MTVEINLLALLHKTKASETNIPTHGNADKKRHAKVVVNFDNKQRKANARYDSGTPMHMGAIPQVPNKPHPKGKP